MSLRVLTLVGLVFTLLGCASSDPYKARDPDQASRANTELGISYMRQGNLNLSMEYFKKAIDQDRSNAQAHAGIAVLYERLEQYDDAERSFRQALRLDPDNSSVRNNYGRFLCKQEQYAKADEQFRKAIDDPLYERRELPLANAGMCALRAGNREQAQDYLRRALERSPRFPPALRLMAELQLDRSEYLSARGYFQRYRDVAELDARALWLGIQIEHALGNRDDVASFGLRLRADYPDSEETQKFRRLERDGTI